MNNTLQHTKLHSRTQHRVVALILYDQTKPTERKNTSKNKYKKKNHREESKPIRSQFGCFRQLKIDIFTI